MIVEVKKRFSVVDFTAILGIAIILIVSSIFNLDKYLFRLPFVTLFAFYIIGKYARDYEIKLWDRRHSQTDTEQSVTKGDV